MLRIILMIIAINVNFVFAQRIIEKCEECILYSKLIAIPDLNSKEKFREEKMKRFNTDIYSFYIEENISTDRISMRNFFKEIKDSIKLVNAMDVGIQLTTYIKSNWKFKDVEKAYCALFGNLSIHDEGVIQIYILKMKNKSAANDLFSIVKQGIRSRKCAYVLQKGKNVVVINVQYYHNMAYRFLKCLDKEICFNKVNFGDSPRIRKQKKRKQK